jgi:D-sedoheptulose 7-phosphate isomerase
MLDIAAIFSDHCNVVAQLEQFIPQIKQCVEVIKQRFALGGKILWMGNGGSAADAQHMAAELVGRFNKERKALPSIALTTDSSILTSISNDYDFSMIFSRQLEALCNTNDIVFGLSTSGNSENVLRGIAVAKQRHAFTIGFTGHDGGKLKSEVDVCFVVPSKKTARIQEAHTLLCHVLCEAIEYNL